MLNCEDYMKIFHEIKNSVTLINSYLQLLKKKHPGIQDLSYWNESVNEVGRLRSIVTELSQVKLGDSLNQESMDIRDFVSEICDASPYIGPNEEIRYQVSQSDIPLMTLIDSVQLRHAFTNLLKNACEAMEQGGTISIDTGIRDQSVFIRVTDTGGGIPIDIADQLFDPFATTKSEGSGLGLVITKQIVESHHGILEYESRTGDGCTFTIHLPAF